MSANLENSAVAMGLEKLSFHSNPKSHMLSKECSKFSKPGFNSIGTVNFQMFNLDFEKAEELKIKFPTTIGLSKK